MIFFFKPLIFFFFFVSEVIHCTPWPLTIVSVSDPLTVQKRVMKSRISFSKKKILKQSSYLFPYAIDTQLGDEQYNLEKVCARARKNRSLIVRVLVAECDNSSHAQWQFSSDKGFTIQSLQCSDSKSKKMIKVASFAVTVKHGSLFYNGKRLKHAVRLRPIAGHGVFNGVSYDGDFCIVPYKNSFLCINNVGLEDYVAAVLRTESWPGWPLEVNKVFAIACRSYGAYKVLEAQRSKKPFHVKNSNVHQTYKGRHDMPILKAAVEQTRSVVLGFEGKPILAMFDCCCGGIIPAHIADFDFHKAPYLARTYSCTYCKESSLYSWHVAYDHAAFDALLKHYKTEIAWMKDIHIITKDKAGLVTQVRLKGPKKQVIISGKKLYSLLKEVKSFHFDVYKEAGKIVFTGRGFGHHIGLCQWGTRQMVRDGFDYRSILRFYYPGAYFMRLS
jgi:stage II sporulation protein D